MYFIKIPYVARLLFREIIFSIPTKEKILYLTFDDGPTPEITEWTLDVLKKYSAKATFFCVGKNIEKHPAIFQEIISGNHSIGNHSYDHLDGWKTSAEKYFENVKKCEQVINPFKKTANGNRQPGFLFRPPYGKITPAQISILKSQYQIVMWDILCGDFDQKTSGEKCLRTIIKNAQKGSVVVFHDTEMARKNLFYALPKVMEYFTQEGFRFKEIPNYILTKRNSCLSPPLMK